MCSVHRKILVLCTGNSARSIIAEYLLRAKGRGRYLVESAGARPTGRIHPLAVEVLRELHGIDASDARSKSWEEFRDSAFDLVITVCDHARDACPVWPRAALVVHWSSPDPAAAEGTAEERKQVFGQVAAQIARRVEALVALPDERFTAGEIRAIGERFGLEGEDRMAR